MALLRLDRPDVRNAINTAMLEEMLGHLDAARARRGGPGPGRLFDRPHGPLGGRGHPGEARRGRPGPPDGALRPPLRRADGLPEAHDRRLPRLVRRRRGGDRGRVRPAGRRVEHADAISRRHAGGPGGPRAAGDPVWPLDREVPAPDRQGGGRRAGAPLGPRPPDRARRGDRGGGAGARCRRRGAAARGGGPTEADAARVGRDRGSLQGRGRGPGRMAALGPGPSVPTR